MGNRHTRKGVTCHTGQLILLIVLNTFSLWKGCVFHIGGYTGRGCFIYWRLCSIRGSQHAIELAAVPASLHQPLRHPRRRTHAVGCAGAVAFAVCGVLCQVSKGGGTSRRRRGCRAAAAVCATALARNQIHGRVERKRFSTHAAASSNSCQHHRHHVNALEAAAIVTTCGLVQAAELLTTATKIQMLKCSELSHSTGANCS